MDETAQDASETETPLVVEDEGSETDAPSAETSTQRALASVESETPAPKRGRPKGSKDAQPRTRTKPEPHTPSKKYMVNDSTQSAASSLMHLEEVMANARQQELIRKQDMYRSWLPY